MKSTLKSGNFGQGSSYYDCGNDLDHVDNGDCIPGENDSTIEPEDFWRQSLNVSSQRLLPANAHPRTIIHLDIDCFYAQVEMLRNPELRSKPLGIQQKNIIVTSNYVARMMGVNKCSYVTDAIKKCPELVLVSGEDLTNYRQMSYQISEFIQKYTPQVERLGFDENFIDVSEMVTWRIKDGQFHKKFIGHVYDSSSHQDVSPDCSCGCYLRLQIGSQIAADIREALEKELGITSCAGIAHNKLLAKLVGAVKKPNQQTTLPPSLAVKLISSLPSANSIPGIGWSTNCTLKNLGIVTVQDLQNADHKTLESEFGTATADFLIKSSFGIDNSPVIKYSLPQTLSDEDSFKCCNSYQDAETRVKSLLTALLKRVIEDGRTPQTIRLTVRRIIGQQPASDTDRYNLNRKRESKQCPIPCNIFSGSQTTDSIDTLCDGLMPVLMNLFKKLVDPHKPFHLTLINICFSNLGKFVQTKEKISYFFTKQTETQKDDRPPSQTEAASQVSVSSCHKKSGGAFSEKHNQKLSSEPPVSLPSAELRSEEVKSIDDNHELLLRLLPKDIDVNTVTELPEDVQKEVLAQYGIGVEDCLNGKKYSLLSKPESSSHIPGKGVTSSNKELVKKSNKRYREGTISFMKPSPATNDNKVDIDNRNMYSENAESCSSWSKKDVETGSSKPVIEMHCDKAERFKSTTEDTVPVTTEQPHSLNYFKGCKAALPKEIDASVFSALPSSIQGEIMAHIVMGNSPKTSGKKAKIEHDQDKNAKKVKESGQESLSGKNTLFKYFGKKN
ncbi:DNA polymerase iota-like [Physella acuta]|uniref:DNA polymerase iota-like n=1 Tax=Physella acuta TaxID=109671 RepID=UPI0027DDADD9|nr:DNA polymerase iota-like [Physella acuta]XP_059146586.1 DNA polymerase iota-like [Physella acuta]XP_059146587.1 DNA polymerase iota-like [Physella acuta]